MEMFVRIFIILNYMF